MNSGEWEIIDILAQIGLKKKHVNFDIKLLKFLLSNQVIVKESKS